jgi:C1A family cysteine protease
MRVLILIASLALISAIAPLSTQEYEYLFTAWVNEYGKSYETAEFFNRFNVFKANLDIIREHNSKNMSYTMGMNEFGDMTWEEFRASYIGGYKPRTDSVRSKFANSVETRPTPSTVPASLDWRNNNGHSYVTPVKNQGQCGSCWSFSTTGSVEGAHAIATGTLVSLSEQQLMDCSVPEGDHGCNGGLMDDAFEFIIKNGGICSEASYPYKGVNGKCQPCTAVAKITSYTDNPSKNENNLMTLIQQGPISIAIEADQNAFQFYKSGVFSAACGQNLDHGVLIVGYGTLSSKNYWIVKNSWGASWGDAGYILMVRGKDECGLANQASQPDGAS